MLLTFPTWLVLLTLTTRTIVVRWPTGSVALAATLLLLWPGWLVLFILRRTRPFWMETIALSFGLSVGLWTVPAVALLWTQGNLTYLLWIVLGTTLLLSLRALYIQIRDRHPSAHQERESGTVDPVIGNSRLYWGFLLLAIAIVTYVFTTFDPVHPGTDRLTYTAYLRHFLDAGRFFEQGFIISPNHQSILSARLQTQTWLVILAAIIRVAHVDMLDAYAYLVPPLLGALALLVFFNFARFLFRDERTATLAVLIQSLLVLSDIQEPEGMGFGFFLRIIEDKYFVLFLMLPLALWVSIEYYLNPGERRRSFLLLILVLIGLVPLHPMAFVQFVISFGLFFLLSFLLGDRRPSLMRAAPIFAAALFLALIPLWQRQSATMEVSFGINEGLNALRSRRLLVLSDPNSLYIASPNLITHPITLLAIFTSLFLIRRVRSDLAAQFIMSNMFGVLILGYTPFLTPILGRFITPWMIWRVLWLLPVSLTLALGLKRLRVLLSQRFPNLKSQAQSLAPLLVILAGGALLSPLIDLSLGKLATRSARAVPQEERELMRFLRDHGTPGSYILTPNYQLSNEIPGMVGHSYSLTFRANEPLSPSAEADRDRFYSTPSITMDHLRILSQYSIDYLIVNVGSETDSYLNLLAKTFSTEFENSSYRVYRYHEHVENPAEQNIIMGNSHLLDGEYDKAEVHYQAALGYQRGNPLALMGLAKIHEFKGDFQQARDYYAQAAKLLPHNPDLQIKLADLDLLLRLEGSDSEGFVGIIDRYRQALALAPDRRPLYSRVMESYIKLPEESRNLTQARALEGELLDQYLHFVNENPTNQQIQVEYGKLLKSIRGEAAAISHYQSLIEQFPNESYPHLQLAALYLNDGDQESALASYEQGLQVDPTSQVFLLGAASVHRELGNYSEALQYAERALANASEPLQKARAFIEAGKIYRANEKLDEALKQFEAAAEIGTETPEFHILIGDLYQELGDTDLAIDHFRQAAELPPDQAWHHYKVGVALLKTGQVEEGIEALERALDLRPDSTYYRIVGTQFLNHVSPEQALPYLEQARRLDPYDLQLQVTLAGMYRELGDPDAAMALTRSLAESGDESIARQARLELARIYESQDELELALEQVLALIDQDPTVANYHMQAGGLYRGLGDLDRAIYHYRQAAALPPDQAWHHYALGAALLEAGEREEGAAELEAALALNPDVQYHLLVGNLIRERFSPETALPYFQQAVELAPEDAEAHLALAEAYRQLDSRPLALHHAGQAARFAGDDDTRAEAYALEGALLEAQGRLEAALDRYLTALEHRPDSSGYHVIAGDLYRQMGDLEAAIEHYRIAAGMPPELPWKHYLLGSTLLRVGETEEATLALQEALSLSDAESEIPDLILSLVEKHDLVLDVPTPNP